MQPWKNLEKEVAKRLDGVRVIRESFNKSDCDVRHPIYSIECKYRSSVGFWYNQALDEVRYSGHRLVLTREPSKFVREAIKQAVLYAPDKLPVAVVKIKHKEFDDSLVFMYAWHFPMAWIKTHVVLAGTPVIMYTGLKEFGAYWQSRKDALLPTKPNYE